MTGSASLKPILVKLVPVCVVVGAGMEMFMIKTGFCKWKEFFMGFILIFLWIDETLRQNEAERRRQYHLEHPKVSES